MDAERRDWDFALAARRNNPSASWCPYDATGALIHDPSTAAARFGEAFFNVASQPRFQIPRGSRVYTIGSCFARNVEAELARHGFELPALSVPFEREIYRRPPAYTHTLLNKYNTHSVADEILRAIGQRTYPNSGLFELREGVWFDPATSLIEPGPREKIQGIRDKVDQIQAALPTSDFLIITLGLTETWEDCETGAVFNDFNPIALRPMRARMRFFNSTVNESYKVLSEAIAALKAKAPALRVIITVSPVPLQLTFTSMDIVSANAYSKSVLRCVAQMLWDEFDYVDYFPSYEMVLNSPHATSWHDDHAHPRRELVSQVIGTFAERYIVDRAERATPAA